MRSILAARWSHAADRQHKQRVLRPSVLISLTLLFVLLGAAGDRIREPVAILVILVLLHLLAILAATASGLHAWRAAAQAARHRRARAIILLAGGSVTGLVTFSLATQLPEAWEAVRDDPHWPPSHVRLSHGGAVVEVTGPLRWSVVAEVRRALDSAPAAGTIRLDSPGGRIGAGLELHALIRERGLDTVVTGGCASACTDAFLAGRRRWAGPAARLGFHQGALGGTVSHLIDAGAERLYADTGIARDFVTRVLESGSTELWVPDLAELHAARVITDLVEPAP